MNSARASDFSHRGVCLTLHAESPSEGATSWLRRSSAPARPYIGRLRKAVSNIPRLRLSIVRRWADGSLVDPSERPRPPVGEARLHHHAVAELEERRVRLAEIELLDH